MCYFLKIQDLKKIAEELHTSLEDVVADDLPPNCLLKKFWEKLCGKYKECVTEQEKAGVARSLKKARLFIKTFTTSLHKHNKHFTEPNLLFLACFGEHKTASLVAKLFLGHQFKNQLLQMYSNLLFTIGRSTC